MANSLANFLRAFSLTLPTVAENLALDEALLVEADEGRAGALLRFWEPRSFAVILGASRRIARDVDVGACRADGVPLYRRSSGGGTVVIGPGVLNVTVVLPQNAAPGLAGVTTAQRYVLNRIAGALAARVPELTVEGSGDLASAGLKCAGSAQRRLRHWFFVHVSILCEFPLERIARYLREPDRQPDYRRGRPHAEFVCNLGIAPAVAQAAIAEEWSGGPSSRLHDQGEGFETEVPIPQVPVSLLERILAERFANPAWIERL